MHHAGAGAVGHERDIPESFVDPGQRRVQGIGIVGGLGGCSKRQSQRRNQGRFSDRFHEPNLVGAMKDEKTRGMAGDGRFQRISRHARQVE